MEQALIFILNGYPFESKEHAMTFIRFNQTPHALPFP